jgi:sulfur carrier protein
MMTIEIRLFATFRESRGKIVWLDCPHGTTVGEALAKLDILPADVAILLRNGRDTDILTSLQDGDTLSLFPPVGGG